MSSNLLQLTSSKLQLDERYHKSVVAPAYEVKASMLHIQLDAGM